MIYEYYCETCGEITQVERSMTDEIPQLYPCHICGEDAKRIWGNQFLIVPEHMKATGKDSVYHNNTASDFNYISSRMKHGVRPSGRDKTVF